MGKTEERTTHPTRSYISRGPTASQTHEESFSDRSRLFIERCQSYKPRDLCLLLFLATSFAANHHDCAGNLRLLRSPTSHFCCLLPSATLRTSLRVPETFPRYASTDDNKKSNIIIKSVIDIWWYCARLLCVIVLFVRVCTVIDSDSLSTSITRTSRAKGCPHRERSS